MAMRPQLFSANALAVELGRDIRTVARALRTTLPDGRIGTRDGWRLRTAIDALDRLEPRRTGSRASAEPDEGALETIEKITKDLDAGLTRMRREPNLEKRREIAQKVGPLVGTLDRALTATMTRENDAVVLRPFRNQLIGGVLGEFLSLCRWKIASESVSNEAS